MPGWELLGLGLGYLLLKPKKKQQENEDGRDGAVRDTNHSPRQNNLRDPRAEFIPVTIVITDSNNLFIPSNRPASPTPKLVITSLDKTTAHPILIKRGTQTIDIPTDSFSVYAMGSDPSQLGSSTLIRIPSSATTWSISNNMLNISGLDAYGYYLIVITHSTSAGQLLQGVAIINCY